MLLVIVGLVTAVWAPAATTRTPVRRLLVVTHSAGYEHDLIGRGAPDRPAPVEHVLAGLGRESCGTFRHSSEDLGALTADVLRQFHAVLFLHDRKSSAVPRLAPLVVPARVEWGGIHRRPQRERHVVGRPSIWGAVGGVSTAIPGIGTRATGHPALGDGWKIGEGDIQAAFPSNRSQAKFSAPRHWLAQYARTATDRRRTAAS